MMKTTTFHAFFFHTLRDANTKSITDDLLNFNAFFGFVECMHFEKITSMQMKLITGT
jgi:hypothetical protein